MDVGITREERRRKMQKMEMKGLEKKKDGKWAERGQGVGRRKEKRKEEGIKKDKCRRREGRKEEKTEKGMLRGN
jgi:hypothetical protein